MLNKDVIDELGRKITELLPEGSGQLQSDIEANVHALVQAALAKMNLVTREEFDVQVALLDRTREKLEQIKAQLDKLDPPG